MKPIAACKHPDQHRFKSVAHVSGTKHGRKTKVIYTMLHLQGSTENGKLTLKWLAPFGSITALLLQE